MPCAAGLHHIHRSCPPQPRVPHAAGDGTCTQAGCRGGWGPARCFCVSDCGSSQRTEREMKGIQRRQDPCSCASSATRGLQPRSKQRGLRCPSEVPHSMPARLVPSAPCQPVCQSPAPPRDRQVDGCCSPAGWVLLLPPAAAARFSTGDRGAGTPLHNLLMNTAAAGGAQLWAARGAGRRLQFGSSRGKNLSVKSPGSAPAPPVSPLRLMLLP